MVKGIFWGHLKSTQPTEAGDGLCYWAKEGRLGESLEAGAWPLIAAGTPGNHLDGRWLPLSQPPQVYLGAIQSPLWTSYCWDNHSGNYTISLIVGNCQHCIIWNSASNTAAQFGGKRHPHMQSSHLTFLPTGIFSPFKGARKEETASFINPLSAKQGPWQTCLQKIKGFVKSHVFWH